MTNGNKTESNRVNGEVPETGETVKPGSGVVIDPIESTHVEALGDKNASAQMDDSGGVDSSPTPVDTTVSPSPTPVDTTVSPSPQPVDTAPPPVETPPPASSGGGIFPGANNTLYDAQLDDNGGDNPSPSPSPTDTIFPGGGTINQPDSIEPNPMHVSVPVMGSKEEQELQGMAAYATSFESVPMLEGSHMPDSHIPSDQHIGHQAPTTEVHVETLTPDNTVGHTEHDHAAGADHHDSGQGTWQDHVANSGDTEHRQYHID